MAKIDWSKMVTAEQRAEEEHRSQFATLAPYQFQAMLTIAGKTDAVLDAIAAIPDLAVRAVAQAKLDYALGYERSDPLFDMLGPAIGLTPAQIDEMWAQAAGL